MGKKNILNANYYHVHVVLNHIIDKVNNKIREIYYYLENKFCVNFKLYRFVDIKIFFPLSFPRMLKIIRARHVEFTSTEFPAIRACISALQYFPSHFSSSFISKPMAFFFSTWLPVTPLEVSRLGLKTVCLSERPRGRKGGAECRLFFILKQPHAPRRGTFSANRSENFAITDVCN